MTRVTVGHFKDALAMVRALHTGDLDGAVAMWEHLDTQANEPFAIACALTEILCAAAEHVAGVDGATLYVESLVDSIREAMEPDD